MTFRIIEGDCIAAMAAMEPNSVDAIVTDPPYGLEFMGKEWDKLDRHGPASFENTGGEPFVSYGRTAESGNFRDKPRWGTMGPIAIHAMQEWHHAWATEALRVLKPGGYIVAAGGSRTYHRLTCAIEDAGFEIRDCITWLYSTGFPKSLNLDRYGCQCQEGESEGGREAISEHDVRPVRGPDLPSAIDAADQPGQVLFEGLSEPRLPATGRAQLRATQARSGQPSVEGRRDAQAQEGQLRGSDPRPSAGVGVADGPEGRLHSAAPVGHGADVRSAPDEDGSGGPHGPQPVEQRPEQPATVADEPRSQDGGVWPLCPRCAQPRFPRGLGTALKPAAEFWVLARKPLSERNVAANVLRWGTGALNIDGTRIGYVNEEPPDLEHWKNTSGGWKNTSKAGVVPNDNSKGRWPANVVLGHSPDCYPNADGTPDSLVYTCAPDCAAAMLDEQSGDSTSRVGSPRSGPNGNGWGMTATGAEYGDTGGASRFFYCPKADRAERNNGLGHMAEQIADPYGEHRGRRMEDKSRFDGEPPRRAANHHPTVKPIALMAWLCRMVTPKGGTVLDPFTGSGSTGIAALREGFEFIGLEREPEYVEIARARIIGDAPLWNTEVEDAEPAGA